MADVAHTPGPWEAGQHPAIASGWIVKPILFGANVRILPECEGGHILLRKAGDANLIASALDLFESLDRLVGPCLSYHGNNIVIPCTSHTAAIRYVRDARAAIAKATGA